MLLAIICPAPSHLGILPPMLGLPPLKALAFPLRAILRDMCNLWGQHSEHIVVSGKSPHPGALLGARGERRGVQGKMQVNRYVSGIDVFVHIVSPSQVFSAQLCQSRPTDPSCCRPAGTSQDLVLTLSAATDTS